MKKVFVSSKQGELDLERAALQHALQSPEWDNFTIEFSGAFPDSVREVFLQHVAECDVYLGIFFRVYSQPTVDEYHKAKELGKPILIYLRRCADRDPKLQDFIHTELQPAHKYQEFSTIEELVSHLPDIRRALDAEVQKHQRQAYLDVLMAQTELLELAGIADTGEQERPKLQEIFVALSAAEEVEERERPLKTIRRVTINEALHEHRHLMILGDPGAGKSTLLRYLALVFAQNEADKYLQLLEQSLPILIRLSSFARSEQSFVEYFETAAEKQLHVSLGKKFFERTLEDGRAIVCLDGLDEVSQPAHRIEVRNAITALAARYPRNRFVVTSRVAGYDSASLDKRAFAHHTIVPFGEKEIQSFVEKWNAAREQESEQARTLAVNLFDDLKANGRLLKLAENPLMLTIIALVHQRTQGKLPEARVELYDRCAETLIEEWDKWKGLVPDDRERPYYRLRRRLLERVAYWMHIESQETDVAQISKSALEMKIAEFMVEDKTLNLSEDTARIEAKQFATLATSRTGILVEREQGAVSFIHLTFQEYFAASDLYWRYGRTPDAVWQAIQPHTYNSRWLEVILLLLGRLNDDEDTPSTIVEKILRQRDKFDEMLHRNLFLAARILGDGVKVKRRLVNRVVQELTDGLLGTHGSGRFYRVFGGNVHHDYLDASKRLARSGSGAALTLQIRETYSKYLDRGCVDWMDVLAEKYEPPTVQLLLELVGPTCEERVREVAAEALGKLGEKEVEKQIKLELTRKRLGIGNSLSLEEDLKDVLNKLSRAINEIAPQARSLDVQMELMERVRGGYARKDAVKALGQFGDLAESSRGWGLFEAASWRFVHDSIVLGEAGQSATSTRALMKLATTARSEYVKQSAAEALAQLGEKTRALQVLQKLAHEARSEHVRQKAAEELGRYGEIEEATKILMELARVANDDNVRGGAYNALKVVVGNLRYAEVISQKPVARSRNSVGRRQKTKSKNHKSAI